MAPISLAKFFRKQPALQQILNKMFAGQEGGFWIQDVEGKTLVGSPMEGEQARTPVICEGEPIGWVLGPAGAAASISSAAALIEHLIDQDLEKKKLAGELIERYRELNLLYRLSDRLAASPRPESIINVALDETLRLIHADSGMILLIQEGPSSLRTAAACGASYQLSPTCCLIESVLSTGKAELANAVPASDYFVNAQGEQISLMCAPLKTEQKYLGVIALVAGEERAFTAGELKLLNTVAMQVAPAVEIVRLYQVAVEKARIEQELQMARQVQESLLPVNVPEMEGWSFGACWLPAREVSGDFYDFIKESGQGLSLTIADVTDKGLPASLFSVFVRSALRASIGQRRTSAETIAHANRLICQDSHEGLFATLFYARLLPETGEMTYVNAGHNPPLFYQSNAGAIRLLERTGLPLGVTAEGKYRETGIRLDPGDFVLFYTDGVTEAFNSAREEFGLERLQEVVYNHRQEPVEQILDAVERALEEYTAPVHVTDDVTMLIVRRG